MKTTEDFKRVWVWIYNKEEAVQRILLVKLSSNSCLCVHTDYEQIYYNNKKCKVDAYFCYHEWAHYSETDPNIKKNRYMTREEVLLDNIDHPRRLFKLDADYWLPLSRFDFTAVTSEYSYIDIPENYKGDFSDLIVKKYEVEK